MPRLKSAGNTRKKKKCNAIKSFPCGYSCQAIGRNCRNPLKGQAKTSQEWLKLTAERMSKVQGYLEKRKERVKPVTGQSHVAVIEAGRRYIGGELPSLYSRGDYAQLIRNKKIIEEETRKAAENYARDKTPDNKQKLDSLMRGRTDVVGVRSYRLEPAMRKLRERLLGDSAITKDVAQLIVDQVVFDSSVINKKSVAYNMRQFFVVTNALGSDSLALVYQIEDRASASRNSIDVSRFATSDNIYHEMGHHIEFSSEQARVVATDWRDARARGNPPAQLSELTGDSRYPRDEVAVPDEFYSPYVGRVYDSGVTEVIATGLEHFHSPEAMAKLYVQDPEHFELIIGIIRG